MEIEDAASPVVVGVVGTTDLRTAAAGVDYAILLVRAFFSILLDCVLLYSGGVFGGGRGVCLCVCVDDR